MSEVTRGAHLSKCSIPARFEVMAIPAMIVEKIAVPTLCGNTAYKTELLPPVN